MNTLVNEISNKSKNVPCENLFTETNETLNNIIKSSPFTGHFNRIRAELQKKIIASSEDCSSTNQFYNPKLMKIIDSRLNIIPMWSFVIANELNSRGYSENIINRLTNNPVENYFKETKYEVCCAIY